jgi:thymidylate synthase (FAD)
MNVSLIHITQDAEKLMAYCARVSSSKQDNPEYEKLLGYCIKNSHWSVFEMASMCVEIVTSRAIAQQILRHRSFNFQEFSQRYAEVTNFELYEARRQDTKNRQNSIDDMSEETKGWFLYAQASIQERSEALYEEALKLGIAKEQARFLLPLSTTTKLYMHGTVRSFIHYLNLRTGNGTQKEHKEIAEAIKAIFIEQLPTVSKALEWTT